MKNPILECDQLSHERLFALVNGDCLALRVSNFFDQDLCATLADRITKFSGLRSFRFVANMDRFGPSLAEIVREQDLLEEYLGEALVELVGFRDLCSPYLTPIDLLRLRMDEAWRAGANLATIHGRKTFTGVARIMREGGFTSPHQDTMVAPNVDLSSFVVEQLAANIYLQTSNEGGNLELWDLRLPFDEYQAIRSPGKAGVLRDRLPPCDLSIAPKQGDLIMFRSTRLHAIQQTSGASRVTCSSFIGYNSLDKPLVFYC